ncbi:substrate-binding periplasmic protein [Leeia oryzae]|uniref:substrate-binding periplasmic protein n=1 Tax=Leeia oryzae TaxID=356662 RepID=UPI00037BC252|nr:transporter substrate-binding domain-containing protein [Leeia oryzae]
MNLKKTNILRWCSASLLCALAWPATATTLKVMIGHGDGEPIVEFANKQQPNKLTGGVMHDLAYALGKQLKLDIAFVEFSRKRVEPSLRDGGAHLACNTSPDWFEHKDWFVWSKPVFDQVETFVTLSDAAKHPNLPEDLNGLKLGTILGYGYPNLDKQFANGTKRVDEPTVAGNFKKLKLKMIDVLISSRGEIGAFLHKLPDNERDDFWVSKNDLTVTPTYCALSPKAPIKLDALNNALLAIKQSGELGRILRKYDLKLSD